MELCSGEDSGLVVDVWRHSSEMGKKTLQMWLDLLCRKPTLLKRITIRWRKNAVAAVERGVPYFKRDVGRYLLSDDALGNSAYQTSLSPSAEQLDDLCWGMMDESTFAFVSQVQRGHQKSAKFIPEKVNQTPACTAKIPLSPDAP